MTLRKTFKFLFITIITLILIIISGITLLVTIVNPNRFKPIITSSVENATGRQLNLDGNISWTIYPNLGIKIENISLSNPKEFADTKFLQLKSANIAVELMPLIDHKIIFNALDINGLNVALIQKGKINNWTFTENNKEIPNPQTTKKQDIELAFKDLSLTNSSISYNDMNTKSTKSIKNFNFTINSGFGGGVKLDTKASTLSLRKITVNYNDEIIGKINLDVPNLNTTKYNGSLDFSTLHVNALLNDFNLAPKTKMSILKNLTFMANVDGDSNNLQVSKFHFNANNTINGSGNVNVTNFKNPNISGQINIPTFSAAAVMSQIGMAPINLANKDILDKVSFKSPFVATLKNINFTNLSLKAGNNTATGSANITSFKPINVVENINMNNLEVSDFSNINGFKVPLNGVHAAGNVSIGNDGIKSLNGKQNITINRITLIGFDLPTQIHQINAILTNNGNEKTDVLSAAANSAKLNQEMNNVKNSINAAVKPGPKNPNLISNIGNFSLNANFHNGIASPSNFKLSGPDLALNGNGGLSIPNKSLNYKIAGKIMTPGIDPLFKNLIVKAGVTGTFTDPSINLDWNSLIQQLLTYAIQNSGKEIKKAVDTQIKKSVGEAINQAIGNAIGNIFHKPTPAQQH